MVTRVIPENRNIVSGRGWRLSGDFFEVDGEKSEEADGGGGEA